MATLAATGIATEVSLSHWGRLEGGKNVSDDERKLGGAGGWTGGKD
eukprot:CAMPEP_0181383624 /NCGR_PEP_ID=MMETSP1106-20121128/21468_1 /TAXON_ID=81844 /ORGANISM="Mantoniella antarctica, Strain SL-175" /LENGTH=45 /DNA_ID= /DNA_START= /DNA_END= /DNA_ORIENTATION=